MFRKMASKGASMIEGVIALAIFVIVVASVLLPQIVGADTSQWSTAATALWNTLQVIAIAGSLYLVYRVTSGA